MPDTANFEAGSKKIKNSLLIPEHVRREMLAHAQSPSSLNCEVCGILAGRENKIFEIYKGRNAAPSAVSYELDSKEQLRIMKDIAARGLEALAVYHSHPAGRACPSEKDRAVAALQRELAGWDIAHVIIGLAGPMPEIKAFRLDETDSLAEIPMEFIEKEST